MASASAPPDSQIEVEGYTRVSTQEQAGLGQSLEAQAIKIRQYCEMHDLRLVRIVEDAGISAKSLDRPNLRGILHRIDSGDVAGLVVAKLDRLTRSVMDLGEILGHFTPPARGQLFSVHDSIDTRSASGRMVANIMVTIAQWERETIVERTLDGLNNKRAKGERLGQIPLGYDLGQDGKTLIPNPSELAAIGIIRSLGGAGYSYRKIAVELEKLKIPTKKGAERWAFSTVRNYLNRAA